MVSKNKKLPGLGAPKLKKVNPFSLHHNKRKFKILGQNLKGTKGQPAVSIQKAFDLRSKTLLVEYENRFKNNVIIDKRIGESDATMAEEQKIDLRRGHEMKISKNKHNLFNLNEVDQDDELTHGGIPLTHLKTLNSRMDEEDDFGEDGMLDANFVKDQHFGGLGETVEDIERKNMSHKDRFDEIVQKSKQYKIKAKVSREEQMSKINSLDSQMNIFRKVMNKYVIKKTDEDNLKAKRRTELHGEYDTMLESVKKEQFLGRVCRPTERLKTKEEIRNEEEERINRLEKEKLERMRGNYEDEAQNVVTRSVDGLAYNHQKELEKKLTLQYKDGKLISSTTVEDKPTDKLETKQDKSIKFKLPKSILKPDVPATAIQVPEDYEGFWDLLAESSPSEVTALITKMINSNHPSIKHSNKVKCSDIFSYILQTLNVLCEPSHEETISVDHSAIEYMNCLMPPLFTLSQLDSGHAARALLLVFIEKRDEYRNSKKKRYPFLDTLVFLKTAGVLFPASDFHHCVMSPVKLFLAQILGEARLRNARDVLCSLFVATLLHQYIAENGKFIPELKQLLFGLLLRCVPAHILDNSNDTVPLKWLLTSNLPGPKQLPLEGDCRNLSILPKFEFSMLNDESIELTDSLRCTVIYSVLKLITDVCSCWSDLPSIREIMNPLHSLLSLVPIHKYPKKVMNAKRLLEEALTNLPPHPPCLKVDRGRPKPLRMMEPEIREIRVNAPKSSMNKSERQVMTQKIVHLVKKGRKGAKREILKDNQYLAKQKLKETLASDSERKRKVNLIMGDLMTQESEFKKYQKLKLG